MAGNVSTDWLSGRRANRGSAALTAESPERARVTSYGACPVEGNGDGEVGGKGVTLAGLDSGVDDSAAWLPGGGIDGDTVAPPSLTEIAGRGNWAGRAAARSSADESVRGGPAVAGASTPDQSGGGNSGPVGEAVPGPNISQYSNPALKISAAVTIKLAY